MLKQNKLDGEQQSGGNSIEKCYKVAKSRGLRYFAIINGGSCVGSAYAEDRYKMHGRSTKCRNGTGAEWSNDVYVINGE